MSTAPSHYVHRPLPLCPLTPLPQVPVDTLNAMLADKEALRKVLLRHVVPNKNIEGKDVPNGVTKLTSASGEEIKADRGKFVQVCAMFSVQGSVCSV